MMNGVVEEVFEPIELSRPPADAVLGTPNILPYPKFTGVLSGINKV